MIDLQGRGVIWQEGNVQDFCTISIAHSHAISAPRGAGNYMVAYESEIVKIHTNIYTIDLETPTPAMAYENARHPSL